MFEFIEPAFLLFATEKQVCFLFDFFFAKRALGLVHSQLFLLKVDVLVVVSAVVDRQSLLLAALVSVAAHNVPGQPC